MNKCKGFSKIWFLGLLLVAVVAGCARNGGDPGNLVTIRVAPLTTSIPITGVIQYSALAIYGDGSARNVTGSSTWTSGSTGVATILPTGIATGVAVGQTTITVAYHGRKATAALTVNAATSKGIKLTPASASIPVTGIQQYTAIETFSDGSTFDRTAASVWTSANLPLGGAPVVTVSSTMPTKGLATGNIIGQAIVTATFGTKSSTATLTVNPSTSKGLLLTPAMASIPITGNQQYTLIEMFSDGSTIDRTATAIWTAVDVSGVGVASIVPSGLATGNAAGQASISATSNGKTVTASLTVNAATSVSFTVTPSKTTIPISGNRQYTALETFSDGSTIDRTAVSTWSAPDLSGSGVALILPNGLATGTAAGQATITAKYNGKTATANLTVVAATSMLFTVTPASTSIPVTGTRQYTALETFSDGSTIDRTAVTTWTAPDLSGVGVASILSTGLATGTAVGQATITANYNGKTATANLTVKAATSISFMVTPALTTLPITGTRQYTAIEIFSDGSTIDRTAVSTWTAPDLSGVGVATILPTGLATGTAAGQATITAKYNGKTAIANLKVVAATSILFTVTPATTTIPVTGTRLYTAFETFSDGSTIDRTAVSTWTAPDLSGVGVASILPTGLATGTAAGQATITANYNGKTATANLTVKAATSISFTLTPASTSLPITGTRQYTALETFSDGSTIDRTAVSTWTSPDLSGVGVATILPTGLATGTAAGQATITAKYNGKTATANMTVIAATSLLFTVTPATTTIPVTGTRLYMALETFSDGSTIDRTAVSTWTAPDLSGVGVATILPSGLATGTAVGKSTITAKYNGKTATATLTVQAATSMSFKINPATATVPITGTRQYTAIETFSDGSTLDRTAAAIWTAPDLSGVGVATILPSGLATGTAAGQAIITAKYNGQTATAVLTVTPVTSLSFTVIPATASILVADTMQFSAIETFSNGSVVDRTLASTWTSVAVLPAVGVATIGLNSGIATGVAKGQSTIKATYGIQTGTATLTVTDPIVPPPLVPLGLAASFGTFGGTAGMTNTGTLTLIDGDIGTIATATGSITGFHDVAGDIYTETPANIGAVTGEIFTCTNSTTGPTATGVNAAACARATQARLDAEIAYLSLAAKPTSADPGENLGGLTLAAGVYKAASGKFLLTGSDLTLTGTANDLFVFQMATSLEVGAPGAPRSIILAGGAQAKNVFWQVGSAATINPGGGGTMVGTIISQAGVTFSTVGSVNIITLNGRALSLGASVTMVDTVINVPAP